MRRTLVGLSVGPFIIILAGCGGGDLGEGPLLPVSGTVVYAGAPLGEGELAFYPDRDRGNASRHVPRGAIRPDGSYTVGTTTRPGACAGWYRVVVVATRPGTPPRGAESAMEPGTPWPVSVIPTRYADAAKSGLAVEVVPAPAADAYNLVLSK